MLSVEEARHRILAALRAMPPETVPLTEACNRVLASPIAARLTQPPADISAMDGYAVRAADSRAGTTLTIIGEAPAGRPYAGIVGPGQAVRLFTGSVIPDGADAVLLQEDAARKGENVIVREAVQQAQHIRHRGQDFAHGAHILQPGQRLGPRQIGLAAAANHAWLPVHRQPRVAILATGDEIALPGDPRPPGCIVSSNSFMLASMVRAAGGIATILPIAADTAPALEAALQGACGADLLLTTGGASVGEHDLVQRALAQQGFALDFWKIAMRPGKPMMFGTLGGLPVLGLPGNPVSAFVCAVLFLVPALARLHGLPEAAPATRRAAAGTALRANDHRADHLRAVLSENDQGQLVATPFPRQDSGLLTLLSQADCLLLRPPYAAAAAAGALVDVIAL